MSGSSPLLSSDTLYNNGNGSSTSRSTPTTPVTRTVAIIKNHALAHRFDIEPRIQEARFEIVKERQMEFDTETDPETLYELFGDDVDSFTEGPVWVYVLERRRAVEVWNTLMGPQDPEVARREAPNSLRALYGLSSSQNGLMGSPDTQTAEIQIASLFASSPPFPTTDLPDERFGSMRSTTSSILDALRRTTSDEGYAPSNVTNPSSGNGKLDANGKPIFRARAVPATNAKPDIVPRSTRAAALRAGVAVDKSGPSVPRAPLTKEQLAKTFANVPGHKRAETISVASTAAPVVAPRMTRAAALRLGQQPPPPVVKRPTTADGTRTFEGVPGHKRRETISVASVGAPTVAPRLNKSAALRAQKDQAPPSSFMFRAPSTPKVPGLSRSNSTSSLTPARPSISRPASQASMKSTPSRPVTLSRASQVVPPAKMNGNGTIQRSASTTPGTTAPAVPAKPKPRPSSISAPSIAPRINRSAALRAAKQEMENAAAAAAARKGPRPSTAAKSATPRPIAA